MVSSRRHKRKGLISLLFLVALVGGLGWTVYTPIRQEQLNRALIAAIQVNDTKKVLTLLAKDADPNARDDPQVQFSVRQILGMLLHRHRQDSNPMTALVLALGVRLEVDTDTNGTAISGSPDKNNIQIVKALCDHGADVNGRSIWGYTPLMAAAFARVPPSIIKLLLERGADVNARDKQESRALLETVRESDDSHSRQASSGCPRISRQRIFAARLMRA